MLFKGSGVALVTPFDKKNNVNYIKLEELINFHLANKTDAIIVCGTTGESSTLSENEKKEVIKFVVDKVNGKIPVIAGTGSNSTKTAIEMSKFAQGAGCDGLLIVTPYYNKCSQEGLYKHYKEISNNVSIPIILYNVPSRTGVNITPETVLRLSRIKNICGIKEASGNISQVAKIISLVNNEFFVYSGNDDQTLPILSLGGMGVISVAANIYPQKMHDLCYNYFDNNVKKARKIQFELLKIMEKLFIDVNPIPIKEVMNILGFNVGDVRLPLCKMSKEKIEELSTVIKVNSFHDCIK